MTEPMAAQGNTTAIGLGAEHQRARARALAAMAEGAICGMCKQPMFRTQALHYDHVIPRALGGKDGPRRLVHAVCNGRAGQRLATAARRRNRRARAYTRW